MADAFILANTAGSQLNLGSYLALDKGQPDFGAKDLLQAAYNEQPNLEGGMLAYESVGVRRFAFPVRLASTAAFSGGLAGFEGFVRMLARPGAYIDLIPDGTATANRIRFDVLGGRYEEAYEVWVNRARRRDATVRLEVRPFGYMPTWIMLASAASVGLPGVIAVPGASVLGDVPGWAEVVLHATGGTNYSGGTWMPDFLAWSLAGLPSFSAFWPAASLASAIAGGSLTGDKFAPGSQAVQLAPSSTVGAWTKVLVATIGNTLEPAFRGRFRAYCYAQLTPSQAQPWTLSLDAQSAPMSGAALASAAPIATVAPAVASNTGGLGGYGALPSPAYMLVDLGELSLPPAGSGMTQDLLLRLWANPASPNVGVSTPLISIAGLYLQPLDGPAGILPRGLAQPSILTPSVGRLYLETSTRRAIISQPTGNLGSAPYPAVDARAFYRGGFPLVAGSTMQLDLLGGGRRVLSGATSPIARSAPQFVAASVRYRPRFAFLKDI